MWNQLHKWVRHLSRRFQRENAHAKLLRATGTVQTLAYVVDYAHQVLRRSCYFSEVWGDGVKAFEAAAIEDNGGSKTSTNGALSGRILRTLLAGDGVAIRTTCGTLLLWEKSAQSQQPV